MHSDNNVNVMLNKLCIRVRKAERRRSERFRLASPRRTDTKIWYVKATEACNYTTSKSFWHSAILIGRRAAKNSRVVSGAKVGEGGWMLEPGFGGLSVFVPYSATKQNPASFNYYLLQHWQISCSVSTKRTGYSLTGRVDGGGSCHVSSTEKNNKTAAMEMTHNTTREPPWETG